MLPLSQPVQRALYYVEANLSDESLSAESVVRHVAGDPINFPAQFRRETGFTVKHYIECRRIEVAQRLLRETDRAVADVAFEVGYRYHEVFTRAFSRTVGMSPSQYRAQHRPARADGKRPAK